MPEMYLPNDMKFDRIYYYEMKNDKDDSKPKGEIRCV